VWAYEKPRDEKSQFSGGGRQRRRKRTWLKYCQEQKDVIVYGLLLVGVFIFFIEISNEFMAGSYSVSQTHPNIVLILSDDQGMGDMVPF
jgi:hypothetical protein